MRKCFDRHDCDKGRRHGYEQVYAPAFATRREDPLQILEVGVYRGASIAAWLEYLPNATVYGLDTFQRVPPWHVGVRDDERVHFIEGDSRSIELPQRFDVIIDDGCHTHAAQASTFCNLVSLCRWRYFIEDVWPWDRMSDGEKKHPWLERPGYGRKHWENLIGPVRGYDHCIHDLRSGRQPDSCIVEVAV